MDEISEILLKETSELLEKLIPVLERNIDALKDDSNPLLKHLIQRQIDDYQQMLERTKEIGGRLQDLLDSQKVELEEGQPKEAVSEEIEPEESDSQEAKAAEPVKDEPPRSKLGINRTAAGHPIAPITVKMPDGTSIRRRHGSVTFVEVIEKIGIGRVRDLRIECRNVPLVDTIDHSGVRQQKSENYYIVTGSTTDEKIEILREIANRLGINMEPRFDESPWY